MALENLYESILATLEIIGFVKNDKAMAIATAMMGQLQANFNTSAKIPMAIQRQRPIPCFQASRVLNFFSFERDTT
jgi:hypothetical protein